VKDGDGDAAVDMLSSERNNQVFWSEIPSPAELESKLQGSSGFSQYASMQHAREPEACFAVMDSFRVLYPK